MAITLLTVFQTISLCIAFAALGYALYTHRRVTKTLAEIDKQMAESIEKITPDVQKTLDAMAAEQSSIIEELAKRQGEAIEKVIQKQSEVNKDHKGHIEKLNQLVTGHGKLLRFELDLPGSGTLLEGEAAEAPKHVSRKQ